MKTGHSGNKRITKRKRSWEYKVKPCDDLDGASRRHNAEKKTWNFGKERWTTWNREHDIMNKLRNKVLNHLEENKNKIYCMFILHLIKLMTSNGFGILLILVERIKIDITPTWEGLQRTTSRIWKNERIDLIIKEERSWTNHRKNWKQTK